GRCRMLGADVLERWIGCVGVGLGRSCAWQPADGVRLLALVAALLLLRLTVRRSADLLLTWRATAWSPVIARALSRFFKARHYSEEAFYRADGAGEPWITRRRAGLERLARQLRETYPASTAWAEAIRGSFSDLRFTDANRVPPAFAGLMRERFSLASVVTE